MGQVQRLCSQFAVVLFLLLAMGPLSLQADEAEKTSKGNNSGENAAPARRFDPAKLKQLRDRMANGGKEAANLKRINWKVGNETREALVYFPPKLSQQTKAPLVFAFHGHGGKSEYAARKLAIHEHWPEAICIYPQGLPTAVPVIDTEGKLPGWQKYEGDQDDRDLAFFDAMLKQMLEEYHADPKRIYSTGHSNGGFFTYVLLAARGDKLAAIAPVAASANPRDAKKQKPKPVFHVAGENDPIVRFAGQQRTIEKMRELNGCNEKGKEISKLETEYTSTNGPAVVAYIHPGAHEIPSEAPARIAEFFKKQTLP